MIQVKEEFVGCDKWERAVEIAGGDAIQMWLAIKGYCSKTLMDGFIPDEDIDKLPGRPKRHRRALDALVGCGRLDPDGSRGDGLVEQVARGWRLHDYEEHSNTKVEEELRREKAREKKRSQREAKRRELELLKSRVQSRGQDGDSPGDKTGTVPVDQGAGHSGARPPEPARTCVPNPTQPNPTSENNPPPQDLTGSAPEAPSVVVAIDDGRKVPCPADLTLSDDQVKSLEIGQGVNAYQAKVLAGRFCANFGADQSDLRPMTAWLKCLSRFISAEFANPKHRPPRSADAEETDRQTATRLKQGNRQPNASDHSDQHEHLTTIGAIEV